MTRAALSVSVCSFVLLAAAAALAAGPVFWDSPARVAFLDGELRGAALDAQGSLVPGLAATTVLADSSLVFWGADVLDDGTLVVGSGHQGRVWRVDRDGRASRLADLPVVEIFSVLGDGARVLAGCGPTGQVFAIDRRGEATLLGTVAGGFVWDLARGSDGTIYLATGSPAAVYRLGRGDALEPVVELPADNALAVAVRDDGTLLVATQGPGRVFGVEPAARRATLLLAMDQDEGRRLARGPDGWYALGFQAEQSSGGQDTGGPPLPLNPFDIMVTADADVQPVRAALYRLDGAVPERVWSNERGLTSVAWTGEHGWVGAGARDENGPSQLLALSGPNGLRPVASWDGGDVLDLLVPAGATAGAGVLAVQAHPGAVTRLVPADRDEAVALGAPLDARFPSRWGRLSWRGEASGPEPRFAVRSGMSPAPDATWSEWRELGRGRDLDLGGVPPARSLQWRVSLPAGSRVDAVSVSAHAPNLAPQITLFELQPAGELLRGAIAGGSENVTQRLESGLQIEYSTQRHEDRRLDRERAAALRPLRTVTWHARDPNEDRLVYRLFYRREGGGAWLPLAGPLADQVHTWDTADLADGWYELRLVASDRPANPEGQALQTERVLRRVPVDNTPPALRGWELKDHRDGFAVKLRAEDAFGVLAGAEVVLPDGTVERLDPRDGICDGAVEEFEAVIAYPQPWRAPVERPWTVRVRVWDLHGNIAVATGVLP